ncbi:MAG: cyclic nucleotide-binding domain-containing protein [Parachlamydiales bacterium]
MKLIDRALFLKESPLFSSLPLDLLLPIAQKLEEGAVDAGSTLFRASEPSPNQVFLIAKGEVELRDSRGKWLGNVGAGELIGEEALITGSPRQYEAVSTQPTHFLILTRGQFHQLLAECPGLTRTLLEAFARAHPYRKR